MNNINQYIVKLRPTDHFFFGSEQGESADYYLKSNQFPQQTALLGLIRHQLLIQNNLINETQNIGDKEKAVKLIGKTSFQYDQNFEHGVIEKIGPCFLIDAQNYLYTPALPSFAAQVARANDNYYFPLYNPKDDHQLSFVSEDGSRRKSSNEIFEAVERPGIDKPYFNSIENKSYFKQVSYKCKHGFGFCFTVAINRSKYNEVVNFSDAIVTFGKDSMPFYMEVQEHPAINKIAHPEDFNAILLLSDTYISDKNILAKCELAFVDTIPFRNIVNKTDQKKSDYFNRPPRTSNQKRLQLLKRGSMLFSENISDVIYHITSQSQFVATGYNHFQQLKLNIVI